MKSVIACAGVLGLACAAFGAPPADVTQTEQDGVVVSTRAGAGSPTAGGSSPLRLEYTCEDLGNGTFQYDFELIVDNNDGSYVEGQGWGWIIFGDQPGMPTNLTDFVGDLNSLPAGPFTQFQASSGGHNGPTLGPVVIEVEPGIFVNNIWTPEGVGDSITWSGTSTAQLDDGELLFSTLMLDNGAQPANFQAGVKVGGDECAADCDGSGDLSILDFICFQEEFSNQTDAGDCDGNSEYNILDFVCFQGLFAKGCP